MCIYIYIYSALSARRQWHTAVQMNQRSAYISIHLEESLEHHSSNVW